MGQRACAPHTHRAQRRGTPQPWWGRADRGTCSRVRVFQHFDDATRLPCALLALEAPVVEALTGLVTADSKAFLPIHGRHVTRHTYQYMPTNPVPHAVLSTLSTLCRNIHTAQLARQRNRCMAHTARRRNAYSAHTARKHTAEQGKARHGDMRQSKARQDTIG